MLGSATRSAAAATGRSLGPMHRPDCITLCTDDDALIYARYEGALHAPSDVMRRLRGGEPVDASGYYFRVTPFFETSGQKYAWLNKIVSVGIGRRGAADVSYTVHELL
jgi:hypothetical protein